LNEHASVFAAQRDIEKDRNATHTNDALPGKLPGSLPHKSSSENPVESKTGE